MLCFWWAISACLCHFFSSPFISPTTVLVAPSTCWNSLCPMAEADGYVSNWRRLFYLHFRCSLNSPHFWFVRVSCFCNRLYHLPSREFRWLTVTDIYYLIWPSLVVFCSACFVSVIVCKFDWRCPSHWPGLTSVLFSILIRLSWQELGME